jgi:hypothetical protein
MANPKDVILIDDKATWDKWKQLCAEADAELEAELNKMFDEMGIPEDDAEAVKDIPHTMPNVINPWEALGMTEEEWIAEQEAEADTWED